jgi:DNA adenine methylase
MKSFPWRIEGVKAPPIKCQGIKTKLVPFIAASICWDPGVEGRWIEPFMGSGVVAFNLAPQRAILNDTNKHIVSLYQRIQSGELTSAAVRSHLEGEAPRLAAGGVDYYYEVRKRFNDSGDSFDFLFLNRSCFNGVMRFNRKGDFNVPFGHKPERFSKAYITKITNQVGWVENVMAGKDWEFRVGHWQSAMDEASRNDFIYLDPPYIGRHTDYFNSWDDQEAMALVEASKATPAGVALSMWLENKYRRNEHMDQHWTDFEWRTQSHFYHVGSTESLRNSMEEVLAIKPGFAADEGFAAQAQEQAERQLLLLEVS